MKKYLRKVFNLILKPVGLKLVGVKPKKTRGPEPPLRMIHTHDPSYSYMKEERYQHMLYDELAEYAENFFDGELFDIKGDFQIRDVIVDFFRIYTTRDFTDNTSGSGFHNAFWLYVYCRVMRPNLIVESGVWKGHITWLLGKACPDAKIYGFDKNLKHVEYKNLAAELVERDWESYHFQKVNPDKALVFFGCHVNHAKRILEAKQKGFKHLIFDDNPPVYKIYSHIPGIPTAHMVYSGQGIDSPEISWTWNNKEIQRQLDPQEAKKAKELIKHHVTFPDVGGPTRYGGFAFLTYVQM